MGIKLIDKINAEQTAGLKDKKYPEFRTDDVARAELGIVLVLETRSLLGVDLIDELDTHDSPP